MSFIVHTYCILSASDKYSLEKNEDHMKAIGYYHQMLYQQVLLNGFPSWYHLSLLQEMELRPRTLTVLDISISQGKAVPDLVKVENALLMTPYFSYAIFFSISN